MPTGTDAKANKTTSKTYRITTRPSTKTQHVDPARVADVCEPSSVQARIQQWQAQGAAEALAPDAVSVRSMPMSDCASGLARPRSDYGDEVENRKTGRSREKDPTGADKERSKSTPRRRIISDGHWKGQTEANNKEPRVRSTQQAGPSRYDLSYTSNSEQPRTRRRSRTQHSPIPVKASKRTGVIDDGIRVTAFGEDDHPFTYDQQSAIDEDLALHLSARSISSGEVDGHTVISNQSNENMGKDRKPSKYIESLGRDDVDGPEVPKTRRGKLLGRTKDMFMRSENVPRVSNRVPSIEAWLEEQPDPFVDEARPEVPQPVEIPKSLKKRTEQLHRKRSSESQPGLVDPNKIWESILPKSESEPTNTPKSGGSVPSPSDEGTPTPRRRSRRKVEHDESDGSPSSLRRTGATVRRQREPSHRRTLTADHAPDQVSAVAAEVQADDPGPSQNIPHRTCPPTGVHTLTTIASVESFKETISTVKSNTPPPQNRPQLGRKLTTHDDLMSVLSVSRGSRGRRSARNGRGSRTKSIPVSAQEVLVGLAADEQKYSRELQTLVDGVIPVLLQCALSKTDSSAATALFGSSTPGMDGSSMAAPIINMGIALERLKSLHKRIPLDTVEGLLNWARTTEKVYKDYLQAWRLGFEDVVVNLAPIESATPLESDISRDDRGDLLDGEGKKADVAYLLKRPLVRVKTLGKLFSQIRDQTDIHLASQMADMYAELTALARKRNQEEQARLEDELAANIDSTKTRDIRTLAPTTKVNVGRSRRVKARDFFNLTIYHSSGQRLDCGIELVFRDNANDGPPGDGDVLVCEVDNTAKWLLFPPVELNCISARRGEDGFDLVIMVRGWGGLGVEWHELLALKTDEKDAVTEWMNMLGSSPLPPRLNRTPDFVPPPTPIARTEDLPLATSSDIGEKVPNKLTKAQQVAVPIGEPSMLGAQSEISRRSEPLLPSTQRQSPGLSLGGGLAPKPVGHYQLPAVKRRPVPSAVSSDRSTISDRSVHDSSTIFTASSTNTASTNAADSSHKSKHVRPLPPNPKPLFSQATHEATTQFQSNDSRGSLKNPERPDPAPLLSTTSTSPAKSKSSILPSASPSSEATSEVRNQRPTYHRAPSSTPSRELPTVNKLRTQPTEPRVEPAITVQKSPESKRSLVTADDQGHQRGPKGSQKNPIYTEDIPSPPAHTYRQEIPARANPGDSSLPPATPSHRSTVLQPISQNKPGPVLKPTPSPSDKTIRRRGSSPLKHEYAPSTTSDSSSNYDSDSDSDASSDTSEDFISERDDVPTPLVAVIGGERRSSKPSVPPSTAPSSYPSTRPSTGTRTLAPSDSASQGPYRKVPSSTAFPASNKSRTIALICSWSDRGMWEQIHPDECSVIISPGLIEAFEMSADHSKPLSQQPSESDSRTSSLSQQPLVAFELTPIVPLRRGTALDISIRSPPTPSSKIRTTNNVMFRSRNPEECEALYGMINWARCNNPTYMQLQAARPHQQPSVTFNVGQTQQSRAKSSSWFSFGSQKNSSYRATSAPVPASVDMSVESSGTTTSAFSALKRLGVSNAFNVNRSSVLRKNGGGYAAGGSLYSSSSGTRTGSASSTPAPSQAGFIPGKDGPNVPSTSAAAADGGGMVNNMKIRLYLRKGQHWENLGAGRLTVLPASPPQSGQTTPKPSNAQLTFSPGVSPPSTPLTSRSSSTQTIPKSTATVNTPRGPRLPSSTHTPHRVHNNGREKRILITKHKDQNAVLLDQVLGESCFERVMQTGIAVKVWSAVEEVAREGGVLLGRERVYMLQFGGAREAGWVFGLVGMYRYGVNDA